MTSFSVIIPTRDRPQFLRQAIASVLSQSHAASEIIVVDDGEGAEHAVAGLSPKVLVLDNRRRGPVHARNLGVNAAGAGCIAFLDDDDWWTERDYLARAATAFDSGADFCFADGVMAFEDGGLPLDFAFDADADTLTRDNTILISAVSYRRSLHERLGPFDETLPYYWDWDWYLRAARRGSRLTHLQFPAVAIRVHPQNMSGDSLERERRANLDRFTAKHGLPPLPLKNHLDIARHAPGSLSADG
jgi:glycosyltransferase involved in cell wall biosynthesis